MSKAVKGKKETPARPYRSERRAQQARETRRVIRDAAARLFVERGYAATSVASIAEDAGVAAETVYAAFKNKRTLLKEIIEVTVAGDDEPVAVSDRPWIDAVRGEPDQRRRLELLNADALRRSARVAPMLEVLRSAAATDPELASLWNELQRGRRHEVRVYADLLLETGPLRGDVDDVVDMAWAVGGSEVYRALVIERGWPESKYYERVGDLIERIVLRDENQHEVRR